VWIVIAGCGGGTKPVEKPTGDGSAPADCEPGRCLEDISRVINDHRDDARACYDRAHRRDSSLAGRVFINFQIDAAGNVTDTSQGMQEDQIQDPEVVACVSDSLKKIKFAKSAAGKTTRAYHRFEFSPH
jgi:hypothetical protein